MSRDAERPSWRSVVARAARVVPIVVLLSLLALPGGPNTVRADEPDEVSETKIEIKITGAVSAVQRDQIDELLKAFDQQNPRLKIKTKTREEEEDDDDESKAGKYLFFPLTAGMLVAVVASTVVAQGWRRSRYAVNLAANVAMATAFALVAASSFLLIFDVELEDSGLDVKFWHVVTGTVLVYVIVFHLTNRWRAWAGYLGRASKLFRSAQD